MGNTVSISEHHFNSYCQGDNNALGEFFMQEWSSMVFSAYSIVNDKEVANDKVARVLEKLLLLEKEERVKKFEGSFLYFKHTVYCILRNLCLDHVKVEANRKELLQVRFHLNGQTARNGAEEIFIKDAFQNIKTELGVQQKKILTLHLEGYKNEEIAEQLNISYNTVRNTLNVTRNKLKALWKHFF